MGVMRGVSISLAEGEFGTAGTRAAGTSSLLYFLYIQDWQPQLPISLYFLGSLCTWSFANC